VTERRGRTSEKPRRLSVEADPRKVDAVALAERMSEWLEARGALVDKPTDADVQVVLGGDGTVVRAARLNTHVPVLGIDFGAFGFLAPVPPTRWEARLGQVLRGRYLVREDATLRVVLERKSETIAQLWAVQDVVFHGYVVSGGGQQMAMLDLYLDGKFLSPIPGDGLIVATTPGSSAYNLAAGGSVLTPGSGIFSVTPICAHTPIRASFSIGQDTPIMVVQSGRFPINVCVDGQESFDEFEPLDVAHVSADDRRFRLVTFRDVSFYDRFRQRFNYRIRPGRNVSASHHRH
jgi:NAD+ kinase